VAARELAAGPPLCPSAQPHTDGARVFGIVGGTPEHPRVGYLPQPIAVSDELLALAGPVSPTEVFRIGAPCAGDACRHFDGCDCRLARKLVQIVPAAGTSLPACSLRPGCRWWRQEGKAACLRCPQVVTELYAPTEAQRLAADPSV